MPYVLRNKKIGLALDEDFEKHSGIKVRFSEDSLPSDDLVFRWGVTSGVPGNPKVVNKVKNMEVTTDKRDFRLLCAQHDLAPSSWGSFEEYLQKQPEGLTRSVLVRPAFHAKSQDISLCTTLYELYKATQKHSSCYISEFIDKKEEYRFFIAQNRVVWVIRKIPKSKDDISWGCVTQGEFEYVGWSEWPMEAARVSLEAMKLSGLDFGAVDVMVDKSDKAYVCEINTAPYLTPYYMKCIAKVFKYIVQNGRDHFPDTKLFWKDIIHPAIKDF